MRNETLIIKNFGPIKAVELKLQPFTILIGENGTGKSTIAKVLTMCRYFSFIVQNKQGLQNKEGQFMGVHLWGLQYALQPSSYIFYECEDYRFEYGVSKVRNDDKDLSDRVIPLSNKTTKLSDLCSKTKKIASLIDEFQKIKTLPSIPSSFYRSDVAAVMDYPCYIPTERGLQSIFSLGKNSLANLDDNLYGFYEKTAYLFSRFFTETTAIEPLGIEYINQEGKQLIKSSRHAFIPLANAASGYQTAIPVALLVKYYADIIQKKKTFIIEEPELNLFPTAQNELVQFFAQYLHKTNGFLLTTHSPYILTAFNNLMYAHQVGQKQEESVNKIIEKKYWVNPEEVSAYQLLSDGTCCPIVAEDGLIKAEEIDGVSRPLNEAYDAIQDIKIMFKKQPQFV